MQVKDTIFDIFSILVSLTAIYLKFYNPINIFRMLFSIPSLFNKAISLTNLNRHPWIHLLLYQTVVSLFDYNMRFFHIAGSYFNSHVHSTRFLSSLRFDNNKYPPDNPVVFHRRADISPLLLAALL